MKAMIKQYRDFFLSQEIIDITPYAESILDDDVEAFVQEFEPYSDQELMIDPIEICAAYNSEAVFNYLISTYDYSDYYNPFKLSLPVILMIFERENLLFEALERIPFTKWQILLMYDYMLHTKSPDHFIQFYKAYGIDEELEHDLLEYSLSHVETFEFLLKQKGFKKHLKRDDIIIQIIHTQPKLLRHIEFIEDLSKKFDIDRFIPIFEIEDEQLFINVLDYLLKRHIDLNTHNEFGLTFFHEGLRRAHQAKYLYQMIERGANPLFKTLRGYPSSHQLLFRGADFTLELATIIDFDAKDLLGLTLKDYDHLQRRTHLQLLDILLVVKLVLNMDESAIYELDNAEFFDLVSMHGVDPFLNAYSVIVFENSSIKEHFGDTFEKQLAIEEVTALMYSLKESFPYTESNAYELLDDVIALEENDFKTLAEFAKTHKTTLIITTDGYDINKAGHIEVNISPTGKITKKATVHSHFIDVYYINTYYDVPLENITYMPKVSKSQRFLN